MQENTNVRRCLVAEEPAGVSRGAGARTARATDKKEGKDGSSKIAASLFSFSISLLRSFCGVQLFLDDEDRCSGPMQKYSSLLLLQSDNVEMMSFLLVALSYINKHLPGMLLFRSTASKSADCVPPCGRTYIFYNKYYCF